MATKTTSSRENREAANRPVHEIRLGRLKGTIWANSSETGVRHNTTFSRIYKDGDEWKDSDSFGREDLLLLAKLANQVHTWICEQGAGGNAGGGRSRADEDGSY